MSNITIKGHIISSYYDGIYINYFPDSRREYLRNIWLERLQGVFYFSPRSNGNMVITGYSQYFAENEAYVAYGEDRLIEGRPYVHLHVLVLDLDEYRKANYNIFNTDANFISYDIFRKNEINLQRELRVNIGAKKSRPIDVDTLINDWISGNRIFQTDDPLNLINALAGRIGGNFTYAVDLSPKDPYKFDIIIYRGRRAGGVTDVQPRQVIMDYIEKIKFAGSIFKFIDIFQFLRRLNVKMNEGKSYQEALVELIGNHCRQIKASALYYMLRAEFGERANDILNRILMSCPNSHEFINDPDFRRALFEIRDYPAPPLRDLIEHVKKQERDREWNNYMIKWNGDYWEAYEQLNRIYPPSEVLDKFNELLKKENVSIEKLREDSSLWRTLESIYKSEIRDYPAPPLRDLIEHVKKQERDREWNNYMIKWNGDYWEAYEQLNRIYPPSEVLDKFNELLKKENVSIEKLREDSSLWRTLESIYKTIGSYGKDPLRLLLIYIEVIKQHDVTEEELKEIIHHMSNIERKRLIDKYLRESEERAKSYLVLFDKGEIVETINEKIRDKDGLKIIGCNTHDYIDKNTKCFYLLLQWIKTNSHEYAYNYMGKIIHAFDDLLKTKTGRVRKHVDLSDLERESEEVITKIEKLVKTSNLDEGKKNYILKEIERLKKSKVTANGKNT
ncbi:hypothetical protein DDW11_05050 [Sulfolobus sp. SCGC AB-777_G06]|nr:hypothetical protein DDW11_05050 [Sulfolobus sp. SCGC AB-777_G06]